MFLRTLLFFVVMYFLVKIISRLFLPSSNGNNKGANRRKGAQFFYRNFEKFSQQNQTNHNQQQNRSNKKQFDEIEEAEYEEITEDEESASKSSD